MDEGGIDLQHTVRKASIIANMPWPLKLHSSCGVKDEHRHIPLKLPKR